MLGSLASGGHVVDFEIERGEIDRGGAEVGVVLQFEGEAAGFHKGFEGGAEFVEAELGSADALDEAKGDGFVACFHIFFVTLAVKEKGGSVVALLLSGVSFRGE